MSTITSSIPSKTLNIAKRCHTCKQVFYTVIFRAKNRKYCSIECYRNSAGRAARLRIRTCPVCRKRFEKPDDTYYVGRLYCSRRCQQERGGARKINYNYIWRPNCCELHRGNDQLLEHIIKTEHALGRKTKKGECVHHINGDSLDNRNMNLLLCTRAYHMELHRRMSLLYQKEHFF